MINYMLGVVAGMSIVPFVYLAQVTDEASTMFYVITAGIPIVIIAGTAFLASKIGDKKIS